MSTDNNARHAHKILDNSAKGYGMKLEDVDFLREFLPKLPKQKTLEEITIDVRGAWSCTNDNDWGGNSCNPNIPIEDWLGELHAQLKGLKDAPATIPALPAGMRLAEHKEYGRCVVSPEFADDGDYKIFHLDISSEDGADYTYVSRDSLTFIHDEPFAPAHPEFLETEADYENAPEGTIVAKDSALPWMKQKNEFWACTASVNSSRIMSGTEVRRVLRWGWGE